ncbi:MAG TPA: hypothetical protein VK564_10690, partial [Thermodesulfobacteriota bacterium]|nr:hypothetical protein [Thermodesulfobacteriota bacterium]
MKIRVRFIGMIQGSLLHHEGEGEFPSGITVKDFFKKADRAMNFSKTPFIMSILKQKIPPLVL